MPREITAYSNPLIKRVRNLREKRHRREEGLFIAEGLRIVAEAEEAGRLPRWIFYAAEMRHHALVRRLAAAAEAAGGEAIETNADILHKLSGKDNPQTVLGVYDEFDTRLEAIDRSRSDIWIVAQSLRDPGNLGTILRTGDAVGAGGLILLDDCVDPFSIEAVRASMGALFTQAIARAPWSDFLPWLRAGPGSLVALSLRTETDYRTPLYPAPSFLMVGNEARGLPADYEDACDLRVKLPMRGKADSLNAAIATAVMAYQVLGQRV
ncbi:MAG TPA: RNA methyltransferase [Sphingomonas sp.]